jgi:hypothetical protein
MEQIINIETEYMNKYNEYVGVNPNDNIKFSEKSILEIMARSLSFWMLEKILPSFEMDEITTIKCFYIDNKIKETIQYIEDNFTKKQKDTILTRSELLENKERNEEINIIRKKLKILADISNELYKNALNEQIENYKKNQEIDEIFNAIELREDILNPSNWLNNQSLMRKKYEEDTSYSNQLTFDIPNDEGVIIKYTSKDFIETNIDRYMKFMYNNYPIGYGEDLINQIKINGFCDSAEIYYDKIKANN